MKIALVIIHIIVALALIAIVLMQSGKTAGLSGSIAGGAETFFGKNKGRTIDAILSKITAAAAVIFLVTSVVLWFLNK
ncbi:MAG: preprotein translocase subunit SecG [Clostridia bacterium]|nr:preprotein translocase subunit SecG [Clostridia bacterium]